MFKLDSPEALTRAFRPKDAKALELPTGVTYPLFVRDYLSWAHPAGGRMFLVFAVPGGVPCGIAFDTNDGGGTSMANMCDWCHHSGSGTQVGLLTATVNARKRAGVHVCSDLSCNQKLNEDAMRTGNSVLPHMEKLIATIARFADQALKIDVTGANR